MLKLPYPVFEDKNDEKIVVKYISSRILELLREVLFECMIARVEDLKEDNEEFLEYISWYLPKDYPKSKMVNTFLGFYALLQADDEFVPELAMEYLMAQLLLTRIEVFEDTGVSTVEPMEQHDYILDKLRAIYDEDEDEMGFSAEEKMEQIEDMQEYLEFCFWDTDYMLLDQYTEDELRNSWLNEEMGLGLKDEENVFIVPPEWRK